jgi:hypothetical protein
MSKDIITPVLAIGEDAIRAYDAMMKSIAMATPGYERFESFKRFDLETVTPFRDLWLEAIEQNKSARSERIEESNGNNGNNKNSKSQPKSK